MITTKLKSILLVIVIVIILGFLYLTYYKNDAIAPTVSPTAYVSDKVIVDSPFPNSVIHSPLTITGQARGTWYFEASFPVNITDANGKVIASGPAQAQEDWMTTEFVPFKITLTFSKPSTPTGFIILKKDNPSGLPQNEDSVKFPISF